MGGVPLPPRYEQIYTYRVRGGGGSGYALGAYKVARPTIDGIPTAGGVWCGAGTI